MVYFSEKWAHLRLFLKKLHYKMHHTMQKLHPLMIWNWKCSSFRIDCHTCFVLKSVTSHKHNPTHEIQIELLLIFTWFMEIDKQEWHQAKCWHNEQMKPNTWRRPCSVWKNSSAHTVHIQPENLFNYDFLENTSKYNRPCFEVNRQCTEKTTFQF